MDENNKLAALESILFIAGEPVSLKKLGDILSLPPSIVKESLERLEKRYEEDPASGFMLICHQESVRLATKPEFQAVLENLTKQSLQENLSKAALEVLAIIAYRAPISRAEIETIRGVNCSFTLRNLLMRELIEREGNPEDLRGYIYSPSFRFLESLGLSRREELPDFTVLSQDERLRVLIEGEEEAPSQTETKTA